MKTIFYGEFTANAYATGTDDLRARTASFGLPVQEVDGTDFFAVYKAAQETIEHARNGNGPAALIVKAGRFHGHFTGDPEDYRPDGEVADLRENQDVLKKLCGSCQ